MQDLYARAVFLCSPAGTPARVHSCFLALRACTWGRRAAVCASPDLQVAVQPDGGLTLPSLPPSTTWLLLLVQVRGLVSRCVLAWHTMRS
jgi:hypothetical protein